MRAAFFVLLFFVSGELVLAQNSGGSGSSGSGSSGSGSNWFAGWPSGLPRPVDIPQQGVIQGATLTLSGSLTGADGFTATFEVPSNSRLIYNYKDKSDTTTENNITEVKTFRSFTRSSYKWDRDGAFFDQTAHLGFTGQRRTKNPNWYPYDRDHTIEDEVGDSSIGYRTIELFGSIMLFPETRQVRAAGVRTVFGPTKKSKTILSKFTSCPDDTHTTDPDATSNFSIVLDATYGVDWKLVRDYDYSVNNHKDSNTVTEQNTYPMSNPGSTGSLSISDFAVSGTSFNSIIGNSILAPGPSDRNINFYLNFQQMVTWSLPPFPTQF